MPNRNLFIPILVFANLFAGGAWPARAQALLPHTLRLDPTRLEQQGISLVQDASQLAQFQQYDLALQRAKLATQLAPKSAEVWALLGGLYLQTNEVDNGIVALNKAEKLDGKNSAVLFALGSAYFQKAEYGKSVEYLKAGLKLKPNVPGALFDLGNAYLMQRQYGEAIAQYQQAVSQEAKFWPAINNIGLIKYEQGNVDEALRLWEKAAAMDSKAAEPRLAIAVAFYARKGEAQRGLALGEAAVRLDSRYAKLDFLKENLWGEKLLADTKKLLETPKIRATIIQLEEQRPQTTERLTD